MYLTEQQRFATLAVSRSTVAQPLAVLGGQADLSPVEGG